MYENFFGLKETPFSIAPNPHYLYMSKQHNEALAHLVYGVGREGGFVLLTGEVGTGKTTICRCFLEQIPENTEVAFILNPKLSCDELLATICDELSIGYIGDRMTTKDYVDYINERLLDSHSKGCHTVLIIDEAQNLAPDLLEQLRLLTNLETHEKKLLQIVLLGQPELQEMFQRQELRQLAQRVTARFHLDALKFEELEPYVVHRLAVAGAVDPRAAFPKKTLKALHQISKGIPRIINLVCDRSMLGAYTKSQRFVDPETLKNAAQEVLGKSQLVDIDVSAWWKKLPKEKLASAVGLAAICGLSAGMGIWLSTSMFGGQEHTDAQHVNASQSAQYAAHLPPPPPKPVGSQPIPNGVSSAAEMGPKPPTISNFDQLTTAGSVGKYHTVEPSAVVIDSLSMEDLFTRYGDQLSEESAYKALLDVWHLNYSLKKNGSACKYANQNDLSCLKKIGSLGSLKHLGLPAVLTFFSESGEKYYAMLSSIDQNIAYLTISGSSFAVPMHQLNNVWRGHFAVLWKVPPKYKRPLQPGTIGPLTKWLAFQLDVYEGKKHPAMGRSFYDDELVKRVKNFQREVGEQPDGIVGINTLIQLSKLTDSEVPLLVKESQEQM